VPASAARRPALPRVAVACLAAAGLAACRAPDRPPAVVLATTTSVANSGLLETLLPAFEQETLVQVRVHMVGSGLALRFLEQGQADVAISHAPPTEATFLAANPAWSYRKIMYNDFLVAGPAADPARVGASESIAEAMRRVAASGARFVSRGDESGTHARERELWALAGAAPSPDRVFVTAQGMSATLRVAGELGAYTLTDRATFTAVGETFGLVPLREGDAELLNTYAVLVDPGGPNPAARGPARRFADWLVDGAGRAKIADFRINGRPAFLVWPEDRPRDTPLALPF